MATILIMAKFKGKAGILQVDVEHLNWLSLDAAFPIEQDALPTRFASIQISNERGTMKAEDGGDCSPLPWGHLDPSYARS